MAEAQIGLDLARAWVQPGFVAWGCVVMATVISDPARERQLLTEARKLLDGGDRGGKVAREIAIAARQLGTSRSQPSGEATVEPLTKRELDVLRLFRGDLSLRAIADELYISHNTAKGHTKSIYQKLGVSSRAEAVAAATRAGLL